MKYSEENEKKREEARGPVGRRLLELRLARKMDQETMARMIGVSSSTWRAWEQGRTKPGPLVLEGLAVRLNVSAESVLGKA